MYRKIAKPGTNLCDFYIPVDSLYFKIPETIRNGKHYPEAWGYVSDFDSVWNDKIMVVNILRDNYPRPSKCVIPVGNRLRMPEWAREMLDFIVQNNLHGVMRQVNLGRTIHSMGPKDRKIGSYSQRSYPQYATNPYTTTENTVTNGCKIGNRILSDEAYCVVRMGLSSPEF